MPVQTQPFNNRTYDTILVGGAIEIKPTSERVTQFLRNAHKKFRRVGSVCTGAFALALLENGARVHCSWQQGYRGNAHQRSDLAEHLPNTKLIVYSDLSHGAQYQHKELFLEHVKLFLKEENSRAN
jgi:hypothetical protein